VMKCMLINSPLVLPVVVLSLPSFTL
jgi:hypothetical protein